jgi:hypothetical protein
VNKYDDPLSEAAYRLGRSKGEGFADLLIDRVTDVETARDFIEGFENGDEVVMSLCPDPLSGAWAGDPTPVSVIGQIAELAEAKDLLKCANIEEALDAADDILNTYEQAYRDGFWETALKRANEIVEAA